MIRLDIDLSYLTKHFEINSQRIYQYAGKSIEEVIEAEASQGNKNNVPDINDVVGNPAQLAQLLKLSDATNRFMIIKNLNDDDLQKLLEYLGSEDLVWGLQYFSIDKLVDLLEKLPQEELLKLVLDKFGMEQIVAFMQTDEMDKFLTDGQVQKEDIMNFFKQLHEDQFRKLMFQVMGPQALDADRNILMQQFENLGDNDFQRAMQSFDQQGKMMITYGLLHNKPDYMKMLDNKSLARPFAFIEKEEILKSMKELDSEFLVPMVEELPKDLVQVIVTQIDPAVFADFLSQNFKDILSEIAV